MSREAPSLEGQYLAHAFGTGEAQTLALREVSIALYPGEIALLMGPSGSGKTTLLAVLSGLLRPQEGRVVALGTDLWALGDRRLEQFRLQHCGFIFQGYNLFPSLTVRQQLEMVLRWGEEAPRREARRRVAEMLSTLGIARKGANRPEHLSGGEKQRVAIGRALIKAPDLCFADEPTSALDWEHGEQVLELLRDAAHQRGSTILVVSHDVRVLPFADRVFRMEDGRLTGTESRDGPKPEDPR